MLSRIRQWLSRLVTPATVILPAAVARPLTAREKLAIRDWLALPTTQLVLGALEARHPGTLLGRPSVPRNEWEAAQSAYVLHRIRGWESYRNALVTLAEPERAPAGDLQETYPSQ